MTRRKLPGDPAPDTAAMIRVDQAGEFGAVRIYAGQLAVLGRRRGKSVDAIRRMAAQEAEHRAYFDALVAERGVRPTALEPVWRAAGWALGAATAALGEKAAMACTVAVEAVIDRHYAEQLARLPAGESKLRKRIARFRAEEIAHGKTALDHGAEAAPGYGVLSAAIGAASRLAIALSTRI